MKLDLDDLDKLVIEADPAIDAAIPSPWSAEAHWSYLRITALSHSRRHNSHRFLIGSGIVGTVAAALVVLIVVVIPGARGGQSAAAAVLASAATVAAQQSNQLAPGQYMYTETKTLYQLALGSQNGTETAVANGVVAQFTETVRLWASTGGAGTVLRTNSALQFSSSADRAEWNANPVGRQLQEEFSSGSSSSVLAIPEEHAVNLASLPTAPSELALVIERGQRQTNIDHIPPGPNSTFERTAALLLGPDTGRTPALSSALFRVLATQPGTQLLGRVTDHSGQQGVEVVLASPASGTVSKVLVDPSSGSLLEAEFTPAESSVRIGGAETCEGSRNDTVCVPSTAQATLSPIWTDLVASGVVSSNGQSLPAGRGS